MVNMHVQVWYRITQQDSDVSSKLVYQAILYLVYAGKIIFVKSITARFQRPPDNDDKLVAKWAPGRGDLRCGLAPRPLADHIIPHHSHPLRLFSAIISRIVL